MTAERQVGGSAASDGGYGRVGRGERSAWTFASGLVAARLERLLDESAMTELLQMDDAGECLARVRQTTLGADLSPQVGWLEVGREFDRLFNERVAEWGRDCPDATVVDFFGLQEECRLLKRYAKSQLAPYAGEQGPGRESDQDGPYGEADAKGTGFGWGEALARAEGLESEARDAHRVPAEPTTWLVDLIFDGVLLRAELVLAEVIARRWAAREVAEVIRGWVELQCLLVVARAGHGAGRLSTVRRYFGFPIEADWLASLYGSDEVDALGARLEWQSALEKALGGALMPDEAEVGPTEGGPGGEEVDRVARRGDRVLMEGARSVRWVPFGPEPLFGYLWGLRAEADNLKSVVGGLQAGVSPEVIRDQLRPTYV